MSVRAAARFVDRRLVRPVGRGRQRYRAMLGSVYAEHGARAALAVEFAVSLDAVCGHLQGGEVWQVTVVYRPRDGDLPGAEIRFKTLEGDLTPVRGSGISWDERLVR